MIKENPGVKEKHFYGRTDVQFLDKHVHKKTKIVTSC